MTLPKYPPIPFDKLKEQVSRSEGNLGDNSPAMPMFSLGLIDTDGNVTPKGFANRARLEAAAGTLSRKVLQQLEAKASFTR
ncbi:MAG: hypothetical protein NTV93_13690 [Verrucomicrobia bacterium]|nr:hypothetical protein [Verrucomicrobiota bacterium]